MSVAFLSPSITGTLRENSEQGVPEFASFLTRTARLLSSSLSEFPYSSTHNQPPLVPNIHYQWSKSLEQLRSAAPRDESTSFMFRAFRDLLAAVVPGVPPTAQIDHDEDGALQAVWLVHGSEVTISLGLDREGFILATDHNGDTLLDEDFVVDRKPPSQRAIYSAGRLLAQLGARVDSRFAQR